jgi:hypothetical protein
MKPESLTTVLIDFCGALVLAAVLILASLAMSSWVTP